VGRESLSSYGECNPPAAGFILALSLKLGKRVEHYPRKAGFERVALPQCSGKVLRPLCSQFSLCSCSKAQKKRRMQVWALTRHLPRSARLFFQQIKEICVKKIFLGKVAEISPAKCMKYFT